MLRNLLPPRCIAVSSLLLSFLGLPASLLQAQPESPETVAIRGLLTSTQPNMSIASIRPSPVAGLYEVMIDGGEFA